MTRPASPLTEHSIVIGRILLASILLLLAWIALLSFSGGVDLRAYGLPVSSRNPLRPAVAAIVLTLLYTTVFRHRAAAHIALTHGALERVSPILALAVSLGTLYIGLQFGNLVVGGADSYGYVSQADLYLAGDLIIEQPIARRAPWPMADWTFAPLGYRPALTPGAIVPTYAPGLSMIMAAAKVVFSPIASGQCGPYLVGPALGALVVWLTFGLGRRLVSPLVGVSAAALMASSPAFISALITPMSDVPVAACFLVAIMLVLSDVRGRAFWAGLAVTVAVLIRPNLVPLAAIFAAYLWFREEGMRARLIAVAWFGVGVLPSVVAISIIHTHLYGAPWKSGYPSLSDLYAWRHLATNVKLYTRWLVETQTPFVFACVIPFIAWGRTPAAQRGPILLIGAVTVAIWLSYLFYIPFEVWEYLRFVLTAFPLMIVLALMACRMMTGRLPPALRTVVLAAVVLLVVTYQIDRVHGYGLVDRWKGEAGFVTVARFVDRTLPKNAVIFSMFHSGSLRHYAGRLTIRYDLLERQWWPRAMEVLRAEGYRPYVVISDWEEPQYRQMAGVPDGAPIGALIGESPEPRIRVYDPLAPSSATNSVPAAVIPPMTPCPCTDPDGVRPR